MSKPSTDSANKSAGPVNSQELDRVFNALSHAMRRQILVVLFARGGVMTAGEIADRFKCAWPTTTRHLGVLEQAGVLAVDKQGRNRVYSLSPQLALRSADWIYSWAAVAVEQHADKSAQWKALSYANMRNAIPPDANDAADKSKLTRKTTNLGQPKGQRKSTAKKQARKKSGKRAPAEKNTTKRKRSKQ